MQSEHQALAGDPGHLAIQQRKAIHGVRWSLLAVIGRQGLQVVGALALARILGPESYGIISLASIYVVLVTLLLDQGLSAALVQRPQLSAKAPGAIFSLNLMTAVLLGALTWLLAPAISAFFQAPDLTAVLLVLAMALPLKAAAVAPRAMLSRELHFLGIAVSDVAGAMVGTACGISAALMGASYYSILYQVVATDIVAAVVLLVAAKGPIPNLRLREVRPLLGFSLGIFGVNALAYFSRNIDNILVGRFLGVASLSLYGMAYRVLALPVMLFGQTVNRVMFPVFSRTSKDLALLSSNLLKSMQVLSMIVVPVMVFTACASAQLVNLVLGKEWLAAAPLLSVLAIAGARETIFFITPSLMRGMGKAGLNLRYEVLATIAQVSGIVIGLQFGLLWVAVGYAAGGFVLIPFLLVIQSKLCGARISTQLATVWPPVHASLWGAAAYFLVARLDVDGIVEILLGFLAFAFTAVLVLFIAHRSRTRVFLSRLRTLVDLRR
ncbi:lipopolysaccharide biosynthesis protein [Paeniglutamicibacter antarcticus]|uniref:Lipopolysaccharide biosynthesis protein n=1 Tax=Arthrobacter terrae TaxID=2935737 RepID=A0A931CLG2_9MICC|nr:lipopolysaccharide biosynthesis protein [Arthrobacter terrae]MBG0738335.1 lipopolysaccharide biosynthesis protein [Arthrobacter terrae]